MSTSRFVHLHVHTEFSLADSTIRVPAKPDQADPKKAKQANLLSRAVELKLPALAVTDLNNLFALVKFYKAAETVGIKPIAGADIMIAEEGMTPWRMTLLCRDREGYLSLSRLLTRAWMEGHRPEGGVAVHPEWLKAGCHNLFALAGRDSLAGRLAGDGRHDLAEQQLAPGAIMASNTSTLPISGLAQASSRPAQFIGIHFFSPVDKMQLVEIIRGQATSDETVARAMDYVQALGKLPIVVNDSRGFYTSRTFGTYVMEGAAMLGEGIPAAVIENAAVQAGMPVGPLAVMDETSLTLAVHVLEQTRADLATEGRSYTATPGELLVEKMVQAGRGGRAAGAGFYDYPPGQPKHLWPGLQAQFGKPDLTWDLQEIKDRLLYRQAVETARCLAEGVLTSVHEANIGSIFGIGFPAWTGGALQFIYGQGVAQFAARCAELALRHGEGFRLTDAVQNSLLANQPRW
jgi:3-hydroxyacyl-CoA dehydrogenase